MPPLQRVCAIGVQWVQRGDQFSPWLDRGVAAMLILDDLVRVVTHDLALAREHLVVRSGGSICS